MLNMRHYIIALSIVPLLSLACAANNTGNNNGSGGASVLGGSHGSSGGTTDAESGGHNGGAAGGSGGSIGTGGSRDAGAGLSRDMGGTGGVRAGTGGASGSGGSSGMGNARCSSASLNWRSGSKTNFESYPTNQQECVVFNGCAYEGKFAACGDTMFPKSWVMSHDIVSAYPLGNLALHDLCLKAPDGRTIVVTVYDTCSDSDCSGCCTENRGNADALIDVESFTDMRFGVVDGPIQWSDLGPTTGGGCSQ